MNSNGVDHDCGNGGDTTIAVAAGISCQLDTTEDVFLGGRLTLLQPAKGYRAGLDAVVLAAALPLHAHDRLLDVGAGVGAIGLCAASREQELRVTLVERAPELVALARRNITCNGFTSRADVVTADVTTPLSREAREMMADQSFSHVVSNPPFYVSDDGTPSSQPLKAGSHAMPRDSLEHWVRFMARMAEADATLTIIQRTTELPRLLSALDGRFGAWKISPIQSRRDSNADRFLVTARKGSRAPMTMTPAVVIHGDGQTFTPEIEAVLRQGAALAIR